MRDELAKAYLMFDGTAYCPNCGCLQEVDIEECEWHRLPSGNLEFIKECTVCTHEFRASIEYKEEEPVNEESESATNLISRIKGWFTH